MREEEIPLLIKKDILYIKSNISVLRFMIIYRENHFLTSLKALISLSIFIIFIQRELDLISYFKSHSNKSSYYYY